MGSKITRLFSGLVLVFLLVLLFQNQTSTFEKRYELSMMNVSLPQDCQSVELKCSKRIYSPYVVDGETTERECFQMGSENYCLNIQVINYDTKPALSQCEGCTTSDSRFQGKYNRVEYSCRVEDKAHVISNSLISSAGKIISSCEGISL